MYDQIPDEVDHINQIKTDNRLINLRTCCRAQNKWNTKKLKNNRSGFKGVSFHKSSKLYRARMCLHGKHIMLGYFVTAEEAYAVYCARADIEHGEFNGIKVR